MTTTINSSEVRPRITATDLIAWLGQAAPGDRFEYHDGFLAIDTMPSTDRLAERNRLGLLEIARVAYRAAERGLAHLVQRRNGPDDFTYLIIARPRPKSGRRSVLAILADEAA